MEENTFPCILSTTLIFNSDKKKNFGLSLEKNGFMGQRQQISTQYMVVGETIYAMLQWLRSSLQYITFFINRSERKPYWF